MAEIRIFGYANRISVKPGEEIDFHVSADGTDTVDARLVRLIHGDQHPSGPGFVEEEVESPVNGQWSVKKQFTQLGSHLVVEDPDRRLAVEGSFSLFCYVWASVPDKGHRQTLVGRFDARTNEGFAIGISPQGRLEFWVGDGREIDYVVSELPLVKKAWYFVGGELRSCERTRDALPGRGAQSLQLADRQGGALRVPLARRGDVSLPAAQP